MILEQEKRKTCLRSCAFLRKKGTSEQKKGTEISLREHKPLYLPTRMKKNLEADPVQYTMIIIFGGDALLKILFVRGYFSIPPLPH